MKPTELVATLEAAATPASAPYRENAARDAVVQLLERAKLNWDLDAHGNVLVRVRRGMPRKGIAFVAHLDGLALRVDAVKGSSADCVAEGAWPMIGAKGAKVVFVRKGEVIARGAIAAVKLATSSDGAKHIERATVQLAKGGAGLVAGDFAVLDLPAFAKKGQKVALRSGHAVGVTALVGALAGLGKSTAPMDVTAVFTRAHQIGFQGLIAFAVDRRLARDTFVYAVETVAASEQCQPGSGPLVRIGDSHGPFDPRATALMHGTAKELAGKRFSFQVGCLSASASEATAMLVLGHPAASIGVVTTNQGNQGAKSIAAEQIDLGDLASTIVLLETAAVRTGAGHDDLDVLRNSLILASQDGREKLHEPIDPVTGYPTGAKF